MTAVHLNYLSVLALISMSALYLSSLDKSLIALLFYHFLPESGTFKICTQQALAKKFLVITLQVQSCNIDPFIQCQQGDNLSKSTWDLCIWLCTGEAIWLEKNIYPCMSISHIRGAWAESQTNSRQITLRKEFCTLIFFPTPPHHFQCTKTAGKYSLWHIW